MLFNKKIQPIIIASIAVKIKINNTFTKIAFEEVILSFITNIKNNNNQITSVKKKNLYRFFTLEKVSKKKLINIKYKNKVDCVTIILNYNWCSKLIEYKKIAAKS